MFIRDSCYCFLDFLTLYLSCLFFFFQAEDGIRDLTVTGVQTCALPICSTYPSLPSKPLSSAVVATNSSVRRGRGATRASACAAASSAATPDALSSAPL